MIKQLLALYQMQPSVIIKKTMDELHYKMKGVKQRRRAEIEILKLEKPIYKTPNQ